jgi:hypothetical protein
VSFITLITVSTLVFQLKNGKEISDDEDDDFEEMEEVEFDEVDMLPILQNKTNNNREVDNTVKTIGNTMKSGNAGEGEIKHSVLERKKRKRGQTEWSIGVSEEEIVVSIQLEVFNIYNSYLLNPVHKIKYSMSNSTIVSSL